MNPTVDADAKPPRGTLRRVMTAAWLGCPGATAVILPKLVVVPDHNEARKVGLQRHEYLTSAELMLVDLVENRERMLEIILGRSIRP